MLWFFIALMIVIALAIVLLPLIRTAKTQTENRSEQNIQIAQEQLKKLQQDEQQGLISTQEYDLAYVDLEKTLLSDLAVQKASDDTDSGTAYIMTSILVLLVPLTVVALYYSLGSPTLVGPQQSESSMAPTMTKKADNKKVTDIGSLFESLQQRLEENPDDVKGWMMMGLTYMHYQQFDEAVAAYKKADALLPGDSDIEQALNRALTAQSGNDMAPKPSKTIDKKMVAPNGQTIDVGAMVMRLKAKLEADPDNLQGWMMLGRSYTNLSYHAEAVEAYENALALMPDNQEIKMLLNDAKKSAKQKN